MFHFHQNYCAGGIIFMARNATEPSYKIFPQPFSREYRGHQRHLSTSQDDLSKSKLSSDDIFK